MKIEIDIPDLSSEGNTLYLFSSMEMIAYKSPGKNWMLKDKYCIQCGICCTKLSPEVNTWISKKACNGRCFLLQDMDDGRKMCGLGIERPFSCSITTEMKDDNPNCPVTFKEIK